MNVVHARDRDPVLLPVLVAVADARSVTAAAQRLHLNRSAISAVDRGSGEEATIAPVERKSRGRERG